MSKEGKGMEITIAVLAAITVLSFGGRQAMQRYNAKQNAQASYDTSREMAIHNNLHQIAAAGQQYMLEEDATLVTYEQLLDVNYYAPFQIV